MTKFNAKVKFHYRKVMPSNTYVTSSLGGTPFGHVSSSTVIQSMVIAECLSVRQCDSCFLLLRMRDLSVVE